MPDSIPSKETNLLVNDFLPYRLAVLAKTVGIAFSNTYEERFGISNAQWRVLHALGRQQNCSASFVVQHAALDKVQVSRALAGLMEKGFVARETDPADRRNSVLNMTSEGRAVYDQIAPEALAFEESLIDDLSDTEIRQLDSLLKKLMARSETL